MRFHDPMVRKRRWRVVAALAACTLLSACALVFDVHDFDDAFDAAFDASDGADGPTPLDPNRYRAAVLADHPLAYWRLGESAAAVTAFDETDGGHNAVFAISDGGCGFGADGAIVADPNTAIVFGDGCAATSDASDFYFAGTAPMTIEAWIYSTADGSDSTRRNIFIRTVNLPTPADAGPGCNDGGARRHGYQFDVSNGSVN